MLYLVVGVVVLVLVVRVRRRRRRESSADVFGRLLDLNQPYKGKRWRVGKRPWI